MTRAARQACDESLDWRWMQRHPLRWVAFGFGSGLAPFAPGTFGTAFAWATYWLCDHWLDDRSWALTIVIAWLTGVAAARHVIRSSNVHDHPAIVCDEVAAFWTVLWIAAPAAGQWRSQLVLFVLFRLFDAWKPGPISWLDRNVKGGIGVMLDDAAAAFATLFAFALWHAWAG